MTVKGDEAKGSKERITVLLAEGEKLTPFVIGHSAEVSKAWLLHFIYILV